MSLEITIVEHLYSAEFNAHSELVSVLITGLIDSVYVALSLDADTDRVVELVDGRIGKVIRVAESAEDWCAVEGLCDLCELMDNDRVYAAVELYWGGIK